VLVRSFGITQLIVAVNKLDLPALGWAERALLEVCALLGPFLASVGFRRENVQFVPVSGLSGLDLVRGPEMCCATAASPRRPCRRRRPARPLRAKPALAASCLGGG